MTDKPTGPAAAALEIMVLAAKNITAAGMHNITCTYAWTTDAIEAIILKHCPDNKAVGGLLEGCAIGLSFIAKVCSAAKQSSEDSEDYQRICAAIRKYKEIK